MDSNPIFFLHIPRTGGTTIDYIFSKNFNKDEILSIYKDIEYKKYKEIEPSFLSKIKYITGHLLLSDYNQLKIYNQKVNVFTFLRDPVQRLISEYIFYKTWKNNHLFKIINDNKISFTDYLLSKDRILIYRGKNFMTRCISGRAFISTKHPYAALAIAKRQIEKNFFFFGILERFTESILLLSKILNLQNIFFLHHNKLNNNLKECITDEEKSIALDLNKADYELYKFAVEYFDYKIDLLGQSFSSEIKEFKILNNEYQNKMANHSDVNDIILPKNS